MGRRVDIKIYLKSCLFFYRIAARRRSPHQIIAPNISSCLGWKWGIIDQLWHKFVCGCESQSENKNREKFLCLLDQGGVTQVGAACQLTPVPLTAPWDGSPISHQPSAISHRDQAGPAWISAIEPAGVRPPRCHLVPSHPPVYINLISCLTRTAQRSNLTVCKKVKGNTSFGCKSHMKQLSKLSRERVLIWGRV